MNTPKYSIRKPDSAKVATWNVPTPSGGTCACVTSTGGFAAIRGQLRGSFQKSKTFSTGASMCTVYMVDIRLPVDGGKQ